MTDPNPPLPIDLAPVAAHNSDVTPRPTRPPLAAPLRLKTADSTGLQPAMDSMVIAQETQATPTHLSGGDHLSISPKTERLPSFRHISKIADAAGDETPRSTQYPPPPQSVYPPPSISSQSPIMPHQPYPQAPQISPGANFGFPHQTSPSSVQSEVFYPTSPPSTSYSSSLNGYNPRRQSFPLHPSSIPPPLNAMPTGSSSGESYGHHSSLGDISTSHTTPIDSAGLIDPSRPKYTLMPAVHGASNHGSWYCDHPGCNASPFPTQYLLKYVQAW